MINHKRTKRRKKTSKKWYDHVLYTASIFLNFFLMTAVAVFMSKLVHWAEANAVHEYIVATLTGMEYLAFAADVLLFIRAIVKMVISEFDE